MASATRTPDGKHYVEYEEYVDFQLEKTRSHIKLNDVLTTMTALGVAVLGYLLAFVVLDQWVIPGGFGYIARVLLLVLLFSGVCGALAWRVLWPLLRRVHPLYAARVIERSDPNLKSNLVNFVDIRRASVESAPVVLKSMQKRAAVELSRIDVEQAVDRRPLLRIAVALLAIVVLSSLYIVFSPKDAFVSVRRALLPTAPIAAATETTIENVEPGDTELAARLPLVVEADLRGKAVEEVLILYTTADHKYVDQPVKMARKSDSPRFRGVVNGENGKGLLQDLTYRIVAGDASTPEYRVKVIQPPGAHVDELHYVFPGYMQLPEKTTEGGPIDGWEGATVTIKATANTPVKFAQVVLTDTEDSEVGEEHTLLVTDGTKLSGSLKLEFREDGTSARFYHLRVVTANGAEDRSPPHYTFRVRPDQGPEVTLLAPTSSELTVPANAIIPMVIQAADPDFLLRSVSLMVERSGDTFPERRLFEDRIVGQTFRGEYDFRLEPLHLREGETIQFWIEAKDNKQPTANRARTPRINVHVGKPVSPAEAQQALDAEKKKQKDELGEAEPKTNPDRDENPPPADSGEEKSAAPRERPDREESEPAGRRPENERPEQDAQQPDEQQEEQAGREKRPLDDQQALEKLLRKQNREQAGDRQEPNPQDREPGEQQPEQANEGDDTQENRPKQTQPGGKKSKGGNTRGDQQNPSNQESGAEGDKSSDEPRPDQQNPRDEESPKEGSKPGKRESQSNRSQPSETSQQDESNQDRDQEKSDDQTQSGERQQNPRDGKGTGDKKNGKNGQTGGDKGDKSDGNKSEDEQAGGSESGDREKQQGKGARNEEYRVPSKDDKGAERLGNPEKEDEQQGGDEQRPDGDKPGDQKTGDKQKPGDQKSGGNDQPGKQGEKEAGKGNDRAGKDEETDKPSENDSQSDDENAAGKEGQGKDGTKKGDKQQPGQKKGGGKQPGGKDEQQPADADNRDGSSQQEGDDEKSEDERSAAGSEGQKRGGAGKEKNDDSDSASSSKDDSASSGSSENSDNPKNEQPSGNGAGQKSKKQGRGKNESGDKAEVEGRREQTADSPDAKRKKANGDETGEATGSDESDPQAPKASNDLNRKEGSEGGSRKPSNDPDQKPGKDRQKPPGEEGGKKGSRDAENAERPAAGKKTVEQPPELDEDLSQHRDDIDKGDPEKRPEPHSDAGNQDLKGRGRPPGQQSKQPQTGEVGSSAASDEGKKGANKIGPGDKDTQPGNNDPASEKTDHPGDEKGKGSATRPSRDGKGRKESGTGKEPGEKASPEAAQGDPNESGQGHESGQESGKEGKGKSGSQGGRSNGGKESAGQNGEPGGDSSGGKPGAKGGQKSKNKGDKPGAPGNSGGSSPSGNGISSRPGEGQGPDNAGDDANGGENARPRERPSDDQPVTPEEEEANLEYARKATNLVLQKLKSKLERGEVDQELLDEMGWKGKQDVERFVKFLEEGLKAQEDDSSPEALARRMQLDETLKNINTGRTTERRTGSTGQSRTINQTATKNTPVPAEWQRAYQSYTRSLSKQSEAAKGKEAAKTKKGAREK